MSTVAMPFPDIQTSQLDGRALSYRHREAQLHRLHAVLTASAGKLKLAAQADGHLSTTEVDFEFAQTLAELRLQYEALELQSELKSTHLVETNQSHTERKKPHSIVYIVPRKTGMIYSVISALGAAVKAGSCVIVELPQTLGQTSAALRNVLSAAMDSDTFAIAATSRPPSTFTKGCMLVNQTDEEIDGSGWAQVLSSSSFLRPVAIVDRTAKIADAASAIGQAAFSFSGKAAYAPRIVLVNEFVADEFLSHLVSRVGPAKKRSSLIDINSTSARAELPEDTEGVIRTEIIVSGSRGTILEITSQSSASNSTSKRGFPAEVMSTISLISSLKPTEGTLVVQRISSLDDALSLVTSQTSMRACFLFASLPEANYLSCHISSNIFTFNHIPVELLVGPVAPYHPCLPASPFPRYTSAHFTIPSPQYLPQAYNGKPLADVDDNISVQSLLDGQMTPLSPIIQASGKYLNFFGESIMVGLLTGIVSVISVSVGTFWVIYGRSLPLW